MASTSITESLSEEAIASARSLAEWAREQGAQQEKLTLERQQLEETVSQARWRQEQRPTVESVLETVQSRVHERSLGVFEDLLTQFVQDVLSPDLSVRLKLSTARGNPALEVFAVNANGEEEDAKEGNGGAMANVISTGLRYIMLARSERRPFIVLDEPDCWVSRDRVPAFANVLADLSEKLGIQTVMISHHDLGLLGDRAYRVALSEDPANGVQVDAIDTLPEYAPTPGIRSLRLTNLRSHADSVIPLSPWLTVIQGDSNVGKSQVPAAFKALAGESNNSLIRHGADQARVTVETEHGDLTWVRNAKTNPRVQWFFDATGDGTADRESGGSEVPDFVEDVLNVGGIGKLGLDTQIGDQKRPVYLLGETPANRAKMLSVGRESEHVETIMAHYKSVVGADRRTVREGEKRLSAILAEEEALNATLPARRIVERFPDHEEAVEETAQAARAVADLASNWRTAQARLEEAEGAVKTVSVPPIPTLWNLNDLRALCGSWGAAEQRAEVDLPPEAPVAPELPETGSLRELVAAWRKAEAASENPVPSAPEAAPTLYETEGLRRLASQWRSQEAVLEKTPALPEVASAPALAETDGIASLVQQFRAARDRGMAANQEAEAKAAEEAKVAEQWQAVLDEAGHCPTCGALPHEQHHHRHDSAVA